MNTWQRLIEQIATKWVETDETKRIDWDGEKHWLPRHFSDGGFMDTDPENEWSPGWITLREFIGCYYVSIHRLPEIEEMIVKERWIRRIPELMAKRLGAEE